MRLAEGNQAARILGATMRSCRVARGMSLRGLAKEVGLSAHGTLVDYEHGRRIPPEDLLSACEKALGVDDARLRRLREEALSELAGVRATALLHRFGPAVTDAAVPPRAGGTGEVQHPEVQRPEVTDPNGADEAPPVGDGGAVRRRSRRVRLRWLVGSTAVLALALAAVVVLTHVSTAGGAPGAGPTSRLRFGFETSADRWTILWGRQKAHGEVTDTLHYEGSRAYAVTLAGASEGTGPQNGYVAFGTTHGLETLHSGMRVTVHMWTSYPRNGVRFFVYGPSSQTVWAPETPDNGTELPVSGGTQWSTLTFTVPPVPVVRAIGVQPYAENDEPRVVAIDAVSW
jgi:transcriptional regulator with XRE-family HTH domain